MPTENSRGTHLVKCLAIHQFYSCLLVQKLEKQGYLESIKQAVIESGYDVGMFMSVITLRVHAQQG